MILLRLIMLLIPAASAVDIDCVFRRESYAAVGDIYRCIVSSNLSITLPGTVITEANGTHEAGLDAHGVEGFSAFLFTINFMPQGLDKVFPNLIAIFIKSAQLKQIRQADLQPFTKLRYISLWNNHITFIERDLFKYNTELQVVDLRSNIIKGINPTAFDTLNQLKWLWMKGNQCIDIDVVDNRPQVLELIQKVKVLCMPEYYAMITELKKSLSEKSEQIEGLQRALGENSERMGAATNDSSEKIRHLESALKASHDSHGELIASLSVNVTKEQSSGFWGLSKFVTKPFFFSVLVPCMCLLTVLNVLVIYLCKRDTEKQRSGAERRRDGEHIESATEATEST